MTGAAPLPLWVPLLAVVSMAAAAADPAAGSQAQAPAVHAHTPGAAPGQDDDDEAAAAPKGAAEAQRADEERDGDEAQREEQGAKLALTAAQQEAVGIQIGTPLQLTSAPEVEAYGLVLDPVALLTDGDRIEGTRAAAAAASADATRLQNLYRDGAQASLKALQASQAQSIEANAQAQAAVMMFRQQWGPLANLGAAERRALVESLGKGQRLLLRADVPGHHTGGGFGERALVDIDGVQVGARVLGPLPRTDAQSQSAGWLLEIEQVPPGVGAGARVPVRLQTRRVGGLLVPAAALIYAPQGAYVYRQQRAATADVIRYQSVAVRPLARVGNAWLVQGLAVSDRVVVQGAGVLWSLQGISSISAAEEDHD
jgi:hypothetical protein